MSTSFAFLHDSINHVQQSLCFLNSGFFMVSRKMFSIPGALPVFTSTSKVSPAARVYQNKRVLIGDSDFKEKGVKLCMESDRC